jgi:hypothetical protein
MRRLFSIPQVQQLCPACRRCLDVPGPCEHGRSARCGAPATDLPSFPLSAHRSSAASSFPSPYFSPSSCTPLRRPGCASSRAPSSPWASLLASGGIASVAPVTEASRREFISPFPKPTSVLPLMCSCLCLCQHRHLLRNHLLSHHGGSCHHHQEVACHRRRIRCVSPSSTQVSRC